MNLYNDSQQIIKETIQAVLPDEAVRKALEAKEFGEGKLVLIAAGKAAWQMAHAAKEMLHDKIYSGVVVTKYDHSKGPIEGVQIFEAGHPVPDENSFKATEEVIKAVSGLTKDDTVLFLLSGGGSALFEKPLIPKEELEKLTRDLLACGAEIVEMNTIRKRVSAVKGGRFAKLCEPAQVYSIMLSDIIGNPLDMIASGPAYPDKSTCEQALAIIEKYQISLSEAAKAALLVETPKQLENVETHITGSVSHLCEAAAATCRKLGYEAVILTDSLSCQAKEAGIFLANIAQYNRKAAKSLAFIAGGETVVQITGKGLGGRNQELALSAAAGIAGMKDVAVFSVGSDGTDGPTDAAGGYVDGSTQEKLADLGLDIHTVLQENDSYHALKKVGGLIVTGATGTNVNDVAVLLMKR